MTWACVKLPRNTYIVPWISTSMMWSHQALALDSSVAEHRAWLKIPVTRQYTAPSLAGNAATPLSPVCQRIRSALTPYVKPHSLCQTTWPHRLSPRLRHVPPPKAPIYLHRTNSISWLLPLYTKRRKCVSTNLAYRRPRSSGMCLTPLKFQDKQMPGLFTKIVPFPVLNT